jgi:Protoglobin
MTTRTAQRSPVEVTPVDESRLENDLAYRFGYVTKFIGFTPDDIAVLHGLAPLLGPAVPALVDAVYVRLFQYDATKRHFMPRQSGYDGPVPADLHTLTPDHEQIKFRKNHLGNYLRKLVTAPYDERMLAYLDLVGQIHTPKAGSPTLIVPLVQMNALMGFVSDALLGAVLGLDLDQATKFRAVQAVNKLLWVQNDLITRHYVA